ncbi:M55 family metallopeptidase, partial [Nocardiopsis tropica]|nr:M55 family metallopeptidase [Nocardiopsis tropica]
DAASYAPFARTVAVKDHVSRYAARCRPPARTARDIRAGARGAMLLAGRVEPAAPSPRAVEVEVDSAHLAQAAAIVPGVTRTGVRRVRYTSPDAYEMIRCFKAVTTLISNAMEAHYG